MEAHGQWDHPSVREPFLHMTDLTQIDPAPTGNGDLLGLQDLVCSATFLEADDAADVHDDLSSEHGDSPWASELESFLLLLFRRCFFVVVVLWHVVSGGWL